MPQKYGFRANETEAARNLRCVTCGAVDSNWSWTDYTGEAYCIHCGTPHLVEPQEGEPRVNLSEIGVKHYKEYWDETGLPCGGGTFISYDIYPEVRSAAMKFAAWLRKNHPEVFEEKEEVKSDG